VSSTDLAGQREVPPRVFLSYSFDKMRAPAAALADALRRRGADVAEPAIFSAGENVRDRIARSIRNSDLMIVLVSPGDEISRWMQFETRLMLETCWERADAQIAVVAPAIGAIPSALRHKDFVIYYPHDSVRLDMWTAGTAADAFASQALERAGQGRVDSAEPITEREIREWRNRVVHIGNKDSKDSNEQRERVLAELRLTLAELQRERGIGSLSHSPEAFEQHLDRALLADELDDSELSLAYYSIASQEYEAGNVPPVDIDADAEYRLALAAQAAGDVVAARDLLGKVTARRATDLGEYHPATIESRVNLAIARESLGDLRGAQDSYEVAFEAAQRTLGAFHPQTAQIALRLGLLRAATGEREAARALLRFAEEAYRHVRPADSPEIAEIRRHIAALRPPEADA